MSFARYTVVLLMLLLVPALLFGAITAVYTPEPYLVLQAKPGPFTSDTTFGAKLGTLIVTTTDGDKIYAPTWGSTDEVEYDAILRALSSRRPTVTRSMHRHGAPPMKSNIRQFSEDR